MYRVLIAANWLLLRCRLFPAAAQEPAAKAEPLIQRAREQGLSYLNTKDEKAKKAAKRDLDDAEDLLKNGIKRGAESLQSIPGGSGG